MAQREMGPIPTEFSLWSEHENGNGNWYVTISPFFFALGIC
jgi:hypothetical protein